VTQNVHYVGTIVSDLPERATGQPAGTGPAVAFAAICVGYFAIILDGSVLNVAVPAIRGSLHGSMTEAQWVLNAYGSPPARGRSRWGRWSAGCSSTPGDGAASS